MDDTKKSKEMVKLYGEEYSEEVFKRLKELDPERNEIIQKIPQESIVPKKISSWWRNQRHHFFH